MSSTSAPQKKLANDLACGGINSSGSPCKKPLVKDGYLFCPRCKDHFVPLLDLEEQKCLKCNKLLHRNHAIKCSWCGKLNSIFFEESEDKQMKNILEMNYQEILMELLRGCHNFDVWNGLMRIADSQAAENLANICFFLLMKMEIPDDFDRGSAIRRVGGNAVASVLGYVKPLVLRWDPSNNGVVGFNVMW